ncbi:hypothetical protein ACHAQE_006521 [Botrytis cinerea]
MSDHNRLDGLEAMGHKAHSEGIGYSAIYSWYGQTMDRLKSDGSSMSEDLRSLTARVETWKHFWPDEPFFAGPSSKTTSTPSFESKDQNKIRNPVKHSTSSSSEQHSPQESLTTLSPTEELSKQPIPDPSRSPIKQRQGSYDKNEPGYNSDLRNPCANCNMEGHNLGSCVAPVDEFGFISGCPQCNTKEHLFDECPQPVKCQDESFWAYLVTTRTNSPPIRWSKDIRHLNGFRRSKVHPWTYDFSLKQVGKFEILYDNDGKAMGLYPDPAWNTPDGVLSQAYPRTMDIILPGLWRFHSRLNRKSAALGHKFEVFLKSMIETASANELITCEIVRLVEALEEISEFESRKTRGEQLSTQMRIDITTKQAKELAIEAKLNAYHVPENYRPRNHDSSPDNQRALPSTERKGKGKAIDSQSPSFPYRCTEEEHGMHQNYQQRHEPDNPSIKINASNAPREITRLFENFVARRKFGSNLTPAVENYERRDFSSPAKGPKCAPADTDTQSSVQSEQGESQLSNFAEFKYEQSKEQKQLEKKISNLRRDLKEINGFEKRLEMLTTDQCNQFKMKELKERELRVLLEIRNRYAIYPESTADSDINTSGRGHSFGVPVRQAPSLKYPEDRHNSSSGGSSKNGSNKYSTSEEFPLGDFQAKKLKSKNIGQNPAISTSLVLRHLQRSIFPSTRKSSLSNVQTAPSVGDQDLNDNNNVTSLEKSQSSVVVKQDSRTPFHRRQNVKSIPKEKLNRSLRDARTIASAAKAITIIPRPQSQTQLKSITESQDTFPTLNETKSESVSNRHSSPSTSHTQVATSDSEKIKKHTVISESTKSQHSQLSNEVKNQTGPISEPMESRDLPNAVDGSQDMSSASNGKRTDHVANTNLGLASRDVQRISKIDKIHQNATKLKENHPQQSPSQYLPLFKPKQMLASKDESPSELPQANDKALSSIYKPAHRGEKQLTPGNEIQSSLLQKDIENHGDKPPSPIYVPPQMRNAQPALKSEPPLSLPQHPIQKTQPPEQPSSTNASILHNQQLLVTEVAHPKRSNRMSSSTSPDQSHLEDDDVSSSTPQCTTSPRSSILQQKSPRTMRRSMRQRTPSSDAHLAKPKSSFLTSRFKEAISEPSNLWSELQDPDFFADFFGYEWPNDKLDFSVPLPDPDIFLLSDEDCDDKKPLRKSIPKTLDVTLHKQSNYTINTTSGETLEIQEVDRAGADENVNQICFMCDKVGHDLIDCPSSWRLDTLVLSSSSRSNSRNGTGSENWIQAKATNSNLNPGANNFSPIWSRNDYPGYPSLPAKIPRPKSPCIANADNQMQAKPKSDLDPPEDFFFPTQLTKGDYVAEESPANWIETAEKIEGSYPANWDQEIEKRIESRFWEVQKVMSKTGYDVSLGNHSDEEGSKEEESEDEVEINVKLPSQTKSYDSSPLRGNRVRRERPRIATAVTANQAGHEGNMEEEVRNIPTSKSPNIPHPFQPRRVMNGTGVFYPIPGDWFCLSAECRERNISEHFICKRCYSQRGTKRVDGSDEIFHAGDWVCPFRDCSKHNYAKHVVCKNCGSRSRAPITPPVFWKCSSFNCGEVNDNGVVSCRKCGTPRIVFHNPPPQATTNAFHAGDWYCGAPGCAAHNSSRDISCWKCGGTNTTLVAPGRVVQTTASNFPILGWNCNRFGCRVYNWSKTFNCWQCGSPRAVFTGGPY